MKPDLLSIDPTLTFDTFDIDAALAASPIVENDEPFVPANPKPEWAADRQRKAKRRKRPLDERVFNRCDCYSYGSGQFVPHRQTRPECATDLCQCQIKLAFMVNYPNPISAGTLRGLFGFEDATDEDLAHVAWVIEMNLAAWTAEAELNRPGGWERWHEAKYGYAPKPFPPPPDRKAQHYTH